MSERVNSRAVERATEALHEAEAKKQALDEEKPDTDVKHQAAADAAASEEDVVAAKEALDEAKTSGIDCRYRGGK